VFVNNERGLLTTRSSQNGQILGKGLRIGGDGGLVVSAPASTKTILV